MYRTKFQKSDVLAIREAYITVRMKGDKHCDAVRSIEQTENGFMLKYGYTDTTLESYISKETISVGRINEIIRQLACGLERIHHRGIIHGRITANNIHLKFNEDDPDELSVLYSDFESSYIMGIAQMGYQYNWPVLSIDRDISRKVDVWCLGTVIFKLLTGQDFMDDLVPQRRKLRYFLDALHIDAVPTTRGCMYICEEMELPQIKKGLAIRFDEAGVAPELYELIDILAPMLHPSPGRRFSSKQVNDWFDSRPGGACYCRSQGFGARLFRPMPQLNVDPYYIRKIADRVLDAIYFMNVDKSDVGLKGIAQALIETGDHMRHHTQEAVSLLEKIISIVYP